MRDGKLPAALAYRMKAKVALARILPDSPRLDTLVNLPKVESWRKEHVLPGTPEFDEREEMFAHLQSDLIGEQPIDYLEFGVFKGDSIRLWSELNAHPGSRFFGFDSFEGLPEDWKRFDDKIAKSHFDLSGTLPDIDDDRVSFVPGWFQDTLPGFLEGFEPRSQLVVHIDADLYSSALYVLTRCEDILTPGTIVLFDEFSSPLNEFAALADYCSAYRRGYDVLASAWTYYAQLAIRML